MRDMTSAPAPPPGPADHVRGPRDAPVVIVYADFTCPRCALAAERLAAVPLRVCFRHFALRARHPRALPAALATEAAARQGAFWPFHDALYADQGRLEDPHLWALCGRLGLDLERFEADRRDAAALARVEADVAQALRAGAATTPALVVAGEVHQGAPDPGFLAAVARRG
jgi:protein-disulfide isomerase